MEKQNQKCPACTGQNEVKSVVPSGSPVGNDDRDCGVRPLELAVFAFNMNVRHYSPCTSETFSMKSRNALWYACPNAYTANISKESADDD